MHRSLNPQLFDNPAAPSDSFTLVSDPRLPSSSVMGLPEDPTRRPGHSSVEVKALQAHVMQIKAAMTQMQRQNETIVFKMEELVRTVHARLERFSQSIVRVEDAQSKTNQENAQRFASVAARVNERKVGDMKVQELVDRHNSIIRNFENRMTSLQRLTSEQEMSLHNAQAALDDARAEIARLKSKS